MSLAPTPFDSDAPMGSRRPIVRRNPDDVDELEMIEATWGSNPRFSDGTDYRFVRSEGKTFPSHRCLVPMTEFHMKVGNKRYRAQLDSGQHFYVAGIWEPPMGTDQDMPYYRIVTVAANEEVSPYQERHGAIILPRQVMHWLDRLVADEELLVTPPRHMFLVEEIGRSAIKGPAQRKLAL
jgi:putative SOS response-associated peptidase YedK